MDTLRQLTDQIRTEGYTFVHAPDMRALLEQTGPLTDWPALLAPEKNSTRAIEPFVSRASAVIAIVAWAQAPHGRGCGGLTQGPLLAPLKGWIEQTERRLAEGD